MTSSEPIRVLIVDDSETDALYAREMFAMVEGTRYAVDWARSFTEGVEAIQAERHDVYLVDHHLGQETGVRLLKLVNEGKTRRPVIMLSGTNDASVDRLAMAEGASDYLTKDDITPTAIERTLRYAIERVRLMNELERAASVDSLTGLANRRHFVHQLDSAIARVRRSDQTLGLLLLDLDDFKNINDQLGHDAGDLVLQNVAKLLSDNVRRGDLVARLGGDEFALLLDNIVGPENAVLVAKKVISAFSAMVDTHPELVMRPGCSIGVATFPRQADSAEALVKAADTAMYSAKTEGRNSFRMFDHEMQATVDDRSQIRQALPDALADNELEVHYQLQMCAARERVVGMEALARWPREGGQVPPRDFIPVAEEIGLINALGAFVIDAACSRFRTWLDDGVLDDHVRLTLNVSPHQLRDGSLQETLGEALQKTGLAPSRIELEITESATIDNAAANIAALRRLQEFGVHITLDDFGTGFSSLTHLHELPLGAVKLDTSFVADIVERPESAVLLRGLLDFARALRLTVVAEGVETQAQSDLLKASGCPILQGFLFHRPESAAALGKRLADLAKRQPGRQGSA